jgi:hypothetical protein
MTEPALMSSTADAQWLHGGSSPKMSASAPEFVPLGAQVTEVPQPVPSLEATTPSNTRKASRPRAPLGELTNIVEASDLLKSFKSPTSKNADTGHGHLRLPENQSESSSSSPDTNDLSGLPEAAHPTGLLLDDEASPAEPKGLLLSPLRTSEKVEDDASEKMEKATADSGSSADGESCSDSGDSSRPETTSGVTGNSVVVDPDSLPSIGSAFHGLGECKRCNFFPKGRCQNGKNCSFCHFPHDKRKPSRQEKRERRAAWLEQVGEESDVGAGQGEATRCQQQLQVLHHAASLRGALAAYQDEELYNDETLAYSIFPGLPPILATKLPAPLPLPGAMDVIGQSSPTLPPGLAPPPRTAQPWQPEAEASPAAHSVLATGPIIGLDQRALQQVVSSTPLTSAPLSTTPSPAPTPTAAAAGEAHVFKSNCGTQTNSDFMCRQCEEDVDADSGHQWSREALLRLRGGATPAEAMPARILFRTAPISACGGI